MARNTREARIESREARSKLKPKRDLYTRRVKVGVFVGYWRPLSGPGSWYVRARYLDPWGAAVTTKARLAVADDVAPADGREVLSYSQAVDAAIRRAGELASGALAPPPGDDPPPEGRKRGPYTVSDALDAYLVWFASNRKSLATTRASIEAHIRPALGRVPLEELSNAQIERWKAAIASRGAGRRVAKGLRRPQGAPVDASDREAVRRRRATANRLLTILRAALTRAFLDGRVASDLAWRRVRPFREADLPREQFLTPEQARRLLNACDPDFRDLVRGALLTGCRYGELTALRVRDYRPGPPGPGSLHLVHTKAGRPRVLELTEEGAALLEQRTAGRLPAALAFTRADGTPWRQSQQQRRMLDACKVAGIDPPVTFHGLRDTFASWLAIAGVPLQVIAAALGHGDTRMTMRHYAHLQPSHVGEALRAHLPRLTDDAAAPPKVARIRTSKTGRQPRERLTTPNPAGGMIHAEPKKA